MVFETAWALRGYAKLLMDFAADHETAKAVLDIPFGTTEEVRAEVISRLSTIGKGGGLIIGPTHHVQLDTPVENLQALVDAVHSTRYPSLF